MAGSERTRSTMPGRRSVTSLRLRVQTPTSSPRRWTWMRAPSSFHSTDAGPGGSSPLAPVASASASVTSAAVCASIGCTGRSTVSPTAVSPASPSSRAMTATRGRSPASIAARRTARERDVERLGGGVGDEPLEGAVPQLADEQAADEVLLVLGRRARGGRAAGRTGPSASRPRSGSPARRGCGRGRATVSDGAGAGGTSRLATVRQPTPMRPWRGAAPRHGDDDGQLVALQARRAGRPARRPWSSGPGWPRPPGWWPRRRRAACRHRTILPERRLSTGFPRQFRSAWTTETDWGNPTPAGQRRRTWAWRVPAAVSTVRLAPASAISTVVEPNSVVPNGLSNRSVRCRATSAPSTVNGPVVPNASAPDDGEP